MMTDPEQKLEETPVSEAASEPLAAPEPEQPVPEHPVPEPERVESRVESEPTAEPEPEAELPPAETPSEQPAAAEEAKPAGNKRWYVVKVQSGREDSIKQAIEKAIKREGLERYFGQVIVPVERVTEIRNGKRVVKKRKKFPGYVMAEVEYNNDILNLFRETSGVGDFVGGSLNRPPAPMSDREVQSMLSGMEEGKAGGEKGTVAPPPTKIPFHVGDKVRVRDGIFQGSEGEIKEIREPKDAKDTYRIKVELTVWGRPVPVELEYWQIDLV